MTGANDIVDVVVVGGGMIGAAAARHLTLLAPARRILVLAPEEPRADGNPGPWGSHYDAARITREADASPVWADLAIASIRRYDQLAHDSGIPFYEHRGCIYVGPTPHTPMDYLGRIKDVAQGRGVTLEEHSAAALPPNLQWLCPPPGYAVLDEGTTVAGIIAPRALVRAQLTMAAQGGAIVVKEAAVAIDFTSAALPCVTTSTGRLVQARQILVCAGGWTHFLLPTLAIPLQPTPRTVVLYELSRAVIARLQNMPAILFYAGVRDPLLSDVYVLPPVVYPDGRTYLKVGGRFGSPPVFASAAQADAWFKGPGNPNEIAALRRELDSLVPGLDPVAVCTLNCVITNTPSGFPLVEAVAPTVVIAAGGNGSAAKSSDEIGRWAAVRVLSALELGPAKL